MESNQHIALYYEARPALWQQCALMMVNQGQHGRWVYIADEDPAQVVQTALASHQVDLALGEIYDSRDLHFRASPVRIDPIIAALETTISNIVTAGATQVLLLIEMTWTIRTPSGAVYLREYEAALHRLSLTYPLTIVCLYNQSVLLDRQLLIGLHTHPLVQTGQTRHHNPHFVPPKIFTHRDERAQFAYWLGQLGHTESDQAQTVLVNEPQIQPIYSLESPTPLIAMDSDQMRWKIRCFGQLRVYRANGELVCWNTVNGATRKVKTLFAYLLYRGEEGATVEEIADLLWPEALDLKQSLNRLYHTVRCLRLALSPGLSTSRKSPFLFHRDQHYFLAVPPNTWIDLPMFQELCYRGNAHTQDKHWDKALLCYQSAERLYTGDLFADIPAKYAANREQDWCWSRRYWFREMYVKVLCEMAGIYRAQNNIPQALTYCDRALRLDSVSEMAHQEKMRVLAAARRLDALQRQYRLYQKALNQFDLGQPSSATNQLYQQLSQKLKKN